MKSSRPELTIEIIWQRVWGLVKARWGALLAALLLQILASIAITSFSDTISDSLTPFFSTPLKALSLSPFKALVPGIIGYVVSLLIFPITSLLQAYASVGAIKIFLDILRGKPFRWSRLLVHGWLEWAYMVALANVVFYVTSIGFVLLFIPGMILSLGFTMSGLILVDKGLDPIQALKESWHMMSGQKMFLMLNYFLAGIAMVVGTLVCFIGLVPAIMMSTLIAPVLYEQLGGVTDRTLALTPEPDLGPSEDDLGIPDDLELDPDSDTEVEPGSDEEVEPDPSQTS